MLPGPPLSLSSQQPLEEEAALSLRTGSGGRRGRASESYKDKGGARRGIEKHGTEEVTSPFIGEFGEVSKAGGGVSVGGGGGGEEGVYKQACRMFF